jgi:uncharacterized membrane protein YcaP (DUF421 family)
MFSSVDWAEVLLPQTPILETFVRGTFTYLSLFILMRLVFMRESGAVKISTLLVIVLVADAVQNAMAADYHTLMDGLFLVIVIMGWAYALNWLGFHFPAIQRLVHPPPLLLIKDGQLQRRNMKEELLTPDEVMEMVRQEGLEDVRQVRRAWLEGNGHFSIIAYAQHDQPKAVGQIDRQMQ